MRMNQASSFPALVGVLSLNAVCVLSASYGQTATGVVTPLYTGKNTRLTNAGPGGYKRSGVSADHCVTLCVFEYRMGAKCSSADYDTNLAECHINNLHYEDDWSIEYESATGWIHYDLGFGPPTEPQLFVTAAGYHPASGASVNVTWSPGFDGGFQQTFKLEYINWDDWSSSYQLWQDNLVANKGETKMTTITGLNKDTSYYISLTATNSRPTGEYEVYTEVNVQTDAK